MSANFRPRNPSLTQASQLNRPRALHKTSVVLQAPLPQGLSAPKVERNAQSRNISRGYYEQGLQQRIRATQEAQSAWYAAITEAAQVQDAIRQEHIARTRYERDRLAEAEREEHERAARQQLEAHQARLAEEAERRRIENERLQREAEEAQAALLAQIEAENEERRRQIEEAERLQRERLRECAVCLESEDMSRMVQVACSHWYCPEHLRDAFQIAWTSKNPFQCCQQVISPDSLPELLSQPFRAQYNLWLLERTTPNPIYCSNRGCGVFLPPSQADGPDAMVCLNCSISTCRHCQNAFHPGIECAADVDTQQARALAARNGWKPCPVCRNMVERRSGCLHMTCRCGQEFCYRCGLLYHECGGRCRS